jgi:uncharacterized protein YjbJ (UPF0337 family)
VACINPGVSQVARYDRPYRQQAPLPQLSARNRGGVTVVSLRGELDFLAVPALQAYLARADPTAAHETRKEESTVSILKKIRHKVQTARGKTKKDTGRVTGSRRLKTEGRTDQVAGEAKQATDKVKDAFKH